MDESQAPFLVIGFLLLVFGVSGAVIYHSISKMKHHGEIAQKRKVEFLARAKQGIWTGATTLTDRTYTTTHARNEKVRVDLQLEIQTSEGKPYQTKTTWLVNEETLSLLKSGFQVSVIVDRDVPERVYPNMTGAEYWVWD
jgi:hypothetical protein